MNPRAASFALACLIAALPAPVAAEEVSAAFALGLKGAMAELAPRFESSTGHKLRVVFEPPAGVSKRIADGESIDVVALPLDAMEALGRKDILASPPAQLARGRMGIGIKPGAPRPDVSSPEALKGALLAARAIVHSDPARGGAGAVNSIAMFTELGLAAEMKAKTVYPRQHSPAGVAREVTDGNADLAFNQIHEIVEAGLEVAGPFPGALARTVTFAAAPTRTSTRQDSARALIDFLRGAEGARVFKAHGLALTDS